MHQNKRAVEVSVPIPRPKTKPKPQTRTSRSPLAAPSSSSSSSSATSTTSDNLTTLFSTSISSSSLADLRLSLYGEDPILYSFAEIFGATNSFLCPPLSSSAGWRCSLCCVDAVVICRPFCGDPAAYLAALCWSHHIVVAYLLGASLSGDDLYLVYEYVPGATLTNCLRNPRTLVSPCSPPGSPASRSPLISPTGSSTSTTTSPASACIRQGSLSTSGSVASSTLYNRIKSSSVLVTEPGFRSSVLGTA